MRCGCPDCGNYMIQRERGLFSGCACPACGASCTDCMGTEQAPLETCELSMQAQLRAKLRELEEHYERINKGKRSEELMKKITAKRAPKNEGTPMDTALKFLTTKARTVREVERHLDDSQFGEIEVQQVIDRLLELRYLDDAAYAKEFIRTRLAAKPVSRNKIKEQLLQHEIPNSVISEALAEIDDAEEYRNALLIARKYARQLSRYEPEERKERLMQRLVGRGFTYDDSRRAVEQAMQESI